jgi:hypothetical protein
VRFPITDKHGRIRKIRRDAQIRNPGSKLSGATSSHSAHLHSLASLFVPGMVLSAALVQLQGAYRSQNSLRRPRKSDDSEINLSYASFVIPGAEYLNGQMPVQ